MKAQNNRRFAVFFGVANIVNACGLGNQIPVGGEHLVPLGNVEHGFAEIFPNRAGAIRRCQAARLHRAKNICAPFGHHQPVKNDQVIVECIICHFCFPFQR